MLKWLYRKLVWRELRKVYRRLEHNKLAANMPGDQLKEFIFESVARSNRTFPGFIVAERAEILYWSFKEDMGWGQDDINRQKEIIATRERKKKYDKV